MEESVVQSFLKKASESPGYILVLPITTLCHEFERDYQDYAKPRIFVKSLDELGFTIGMRMNELYLESIGEKFEERVNELKHKQRRRMLDYLKWMEDPKIRKRVEIMALSDGVEDQIYDALSQLATGGKDEVELFPPLIERVSCDKKGIPISYRLNERIVHPSVNGNGNTVLEIKNLTITKEEMQGFNIDDLLGNL